MECLTNMHVGSGDVNYNIIDNEVERDPVTGLPTINSSGVKGALRNHFKLSAVDNIEQFFGNEHSNEKNQNNSTPGNCKFLNANLLLRPMRVSKGNRPYVLVTTKEILEQFKEHTSNFGITNSFFELNEDKLIIEKKEMVEGYNVRFLQGVNSSFIDSQIAVMEHKDYKSVDLPVIARNHLENGISQNLWYEEIVPHKSVFYFTVLSTDGNIDNYIDGEMIQFGGNASIGYGLTKITKIGER
jgi:CRISPR-associated protein Cmr4